MSGFTIFLTCEVAQQFGLHGLVMSANAKFTPETNFQVLPPDRRSRPISTVALANFEWRFCLENSTSQWKHFIFSQLVIQCSNQRIYHNIIYKFINSLWLPIKLFNRHYPELLSIKFQKFIIQFQSNWCDGNPNYLQEKHSQYPEKFNVCAGIVNNTTIVLFFKTGPL